MGNSLFEAVGFDKKGLVCAITQGRQTCHVLIVVRMDAEALQKTVETGFTHYYSRSRQKQQIKGEGSGHTQKMYELHLDYDGGAIMMLMDQNDGITCHTGHEGCFYKIWKDGIWQTVDAVLEDEEVIYGHTHPQRSSENERSEFHQNE